MPDFDPGAVAEALMWSHVCAARHVCVCEELRPAFLAGIASALRDAHAAGRRAMRERVASYVERVFLDSSFRATGRDPAADVVHEVLIRTIVASVREMPESPDVE